LRADEKVVWRGKPVIVPFIVSVNAGIFLLYVFLFILLTVSHYFSGAPLFFVAFAFLIILAGTVGTLGQPIRQLVRYRNTEYVVTDQRIIIQSGAIGLDTRFIDLEKVQEVYVRVGFIDKRFGTGSVFVSTAGQVDTGKYGPWGWSYGWGGPQARPDLGSLRNPYVVQKLLQEALAKAKSTRPQSEAT
jgi:membrane protein YdbS with pleckstrin-like domain